MTDLCETPSFLNIETLKNLDSFLDTYYQDILANLEKFYIEYKETYL